MATATAPAILADLARLMIRRPDLFACRELRPDLLTACRDLSSAARSLDAWAVKQCNGIPRYDPKARQVLATWTDADESAKEKAQAKAEAKAMAALRVIFGPDLAGLEIEFQRDPRGAMVKVHEAGRRNWSPVFSV